MWQSVRKTEEAKPPGLRRDATVPAGGAVELRTGVTLQAVIDSQVLNFTEDVAKQITTEMTRAIIPVKIVLNPDQTFRSIEMNGEVPGEPNRLQIQVGFERRGPADASDFPAIPKPGETTTLDEKGRTDLWDKINSNGEKK